MSRRTRWVAVGVAVRPGRRCSDGRGRLGTAHAGSVAVAPRFVEETATVRARASRTTAASSTSTGGGVAVFDCDGDGRPDVYLAGGEHPAALFRNDSPRRRRRCGSRPSPARASTSTPVTGAYPLDVDADGIATSRCCACGQSSALRGLGDCRFEPRERDVGRDADAGMDDGLQRHLGGRRHEADDGVRQLRAARRAGRGRFGVRATTSCSGRRRREPGTATRSRCRPATARCRSCSATGTARVAGTCGSERPPLLPRRPGPAVAGRARRGAARVRPGRRLGDACRSGAWGSRART